jgi:hypothetical protein
MPSDLSVPRVGVAAGVIPVDRGRQDAARPSADEEAKAAQAVMGDSKPFPNPTLRLDPGLALVVIEFRDGAGEVRDTIPTQAQLDAYRSWERNKSGTPPPGQRDEVDTGSADPARERPMSGVAQAGAQAGASPDTLTATDGSVPTGGSAALGLSAAQDSTAPRAATGAPVVAQPAPPPPVKGSSTETA